MKLKNYQATQKNIWQGRHSENKNEYFHERVICQHYDELRPSLKTNKAVALIGFSCDEGVKRNLGRPGAKFGPAAIRIALGKMAACVNDLEIYDLGNIVCLDGDLENAQNELGNLVNFAISLKLFPVVLGGGHETAFGHYLGLRESYPGHSFGIINFDAHFDLRPLNSQGQGSSGSPFWQIALDCKKIKKPFNYFVLGIQEQANPKSLFDRAQQLGVSYVTANDLKTQSKDFVKAKLQPFLKNHQSIYLSFCLDVMAESLVPAVSAPAPLGLQFQDIFPLLDFILQDSNLIGFDLVELAPPLGTSDASARVAAYIIHHVISNFRI